MTGRGLRTSGVFVLGALVLAGALTASRPTGVTTTAAPAPIAPQVVVTPSDGAAAIAPADPIAVAVTGDAALRAVTVSDGGTALTGTLSPDGRTWTATQRPAFDTAYRVTATAAGPGGDAALTSSFRTVAPRDLVTVSSPAIAEGATVGVAAPIEVRFDRLLSDTDKATAERALTVTTSVPVEGAWAWLPDERRYSRAHWRPRVYWPANTQVTVHAATYGLDLGESGFAENDLTRSFTVGRSQIVRADVASHRMVVERDGQVVMDVPVSYGLESDPRRVTRSGVHVVTAKARTELMTNPAYDYEDVPMHWAVRISNNGEFIHANPESGYAQGRRNVTHGCVNLSTADARAYFDSAIYGDPVEVTNSTVALSAADGDIYDWTIPWDEWVGMSARSS